MTKSNQQPYEILIHNETPLSGDNLDEVSICTFENSIYLLGGSLFRLDKNWQPLKNLPFVFHNGMSISGSEFGLVFFGGVDLRTNNYSSVMWILKNEWECIVCDIPPRAYHASAVLDSDHVLINGGINNNGILKDSYIIEISTRKSREININNAEPHQQHSLVVQSPTEIVVIGGIDKNKNDSSDVSIIDIEKLTETRIELFPKIDNIGPNHACLFAGYFFVCPSKKQSILPHNIWILSIKEEVWIPLTVEGISDFYSFFPYIKKEEEYSKPTIQFLHNNLRKIFVLPIYSEEASIIEDEASFINDQLHAVNALIDVLPRRSYGDENNYTKTLNKRLKKIQYSINHTIIEKPQAFEKVELNPNAIEEELQKGKAVLPSLESKASELAEEVEMLTEILLDNKEKPEIDYSQLVQILSKDTASNISFLRKDLENSEKSVVAAQEQLDEIRASIYRERCRACESLGQIEAAEFELAKMPAKTVKVLLETMPIWESVVARNYDEEALMLAHVYSRVPSVRRKTRRLMERYCNIIKNDCKTNEDIMDDLEGLLDIVEKQERNSNTAPERRTLTRRAKLKTRKYSNDVAPPFHIYPQSEADLAQRGHEIAYQIEKILGIGVPI